MKKIGKVKKNWIACHRHKVGLARAGLAGLSTGLVRQGRAWLGSARPFWCSPGGWKVKKNWQSEKMGKIGDGCWGEQKVADFF